MQFQVVQDTSMFVFACFSTTKELMFCTSVIYKLNLLTRHNLKVVSKI